MVKTLFGWHVAIGRSVWNSTLDKHFVRFDDIRIRGGGVRFISGSGFAIVRVSK